MKRQTIPIQLGDDTLSLQRYVVGDEHIVKMIRVHADENTAKKTALWWLEQNPGEFIDIDNDQRNVQFTIDGIEHAVDPNRIFAWQGLHSSLNENSEQIHPDALNQANKLANGIRQCLASSHTVIALHNNEEFSIAEYTSAGPSQSSANGVHVEPGASCHNFVLVTDEVDFHALKAKRISCVWLSDEDADHPGSLSDHCANQGIRYFNIETSHGAFDVQQRLLSDVMSIVHG